MPRKSDSQVEREELWYKKLEVWGIVVIKK